jgi:uncharacterized protein (DUF58 family)
VIDTEFLKQLDRFNIVLKKRVNSAYAGSRESDMIGQSLVFKDYREYVPGDDFRAIDWRVYGRTNKYFVRQYEDERNLVLHVIIDSSASMNYGRPTTKFDYASMLGLGFAYMGMKNNEKFVISTFADSLDTLRPKKGVHQLIDMLHYLQSRKIKGHSALKESVSRYKNMLSSRSLIVFISDFLFDIEEVKEVLYQFNKHEILLIQVLDGSEKELQVTGDLILKDAESNEELRTFVSNRLKQNYQTKLSHHIASLGNACDSVGGKFVSASTSDQIFDTFFKVLSR